MTRTILALEVQQILRCVFFVPAKIQQCILNALCVDEVIDI